MTGSARSRPPAAASARAGRSRGTAAAPPAPSPGQTAPRPRPARAQTRPGSATGRRCRGTAAPGPRPAASAPGTPLGRSGWSARSARRRCSRRCRPPGCPARPAPAPAARATSPTGWRTARYTIVDVGQRRLGVRPSADRVVTPAPACRSSPATRTMKNSSRLEETIEQKRTRSSSGIADRQPAPAPAGRSRAATAPGSAAVPRAPAPLRWWCCRRGSFAGMVLAAEVTKW